MGCNVEKAKVQINDILNRNTDFKNKKSIEFKGKQSEMFSDILDEIKSNFEISKYVVDGKTNIESQKKDAENVIKKVDEKYNNSSTPIFDNLPSYDSENLTFTYAGIGSRSTPDNILKDIAKVSSWLENQGYKLQTGYKYKNQNGTIYEEGADKAFSSGTNNKELFGPDMSNELARNIAKEIHPLKNKLTKEKGLDLHARNGFQIFGKNLDTPVDFVLFYAEETNGIRPKGGTGQAVEMARLKGIPTINIWNNPDWKKQVINIVKSNKKNNDNNQKEIKLSKLNIPIYYSSNEPAQQINKYSSKDEKKIANKLQKLYPEIEVLYFDNQKDLKDKMNEIGGDISMFQLSKKRKTEFESKLRKSRPELDDKNIDEILKSIEIFTEESSNGDEKLMKKLELLSLHWTIKGNIILPEDGEKIMQAVIIADKNKIDPFSYDSPNDINNAFEPVVEKEKLIDADTMLGKGFTNKREIGKGVTVYSVDNNETGRAAARAIMDNHYSKSFNPWCLLYRDSNGLTSNSSEMWYETYSGKKQIAFQNGKIISFYGGDKWWDINDSPSPGIPITERGKFIEGEDRVRVTLIVDENDANNVVFKSGNYELGINKPGHEYKKWDSNKKLIKHITEDGTTTTWSSYSDSKKVSNADGTYEEFENGISVYKKDDNGDYIAYYEDGSLKGIGNFWGRKDEYEYYPDGSVKSFRSKGFPKILKDYDKNGFLTYVDYPSGFKHDVGAFFKKISYDNDKKIVTYQNKGKEPVITTVYKDETIEIIDNNFKSLYKTVVNKDGSVSVYDNKNRLISTTDKDGNTKEIKIHGITGVIGRLFGFQKDADDEINGVALLTKNKILIDVSKKKSDTLPHEYAHFYINSFRETPIVQTAIEKWGGEEELVQAIGEQVVAQKGEAYNWWKEFSNWIKNLFNNLDQKSKEELVNILTDAFLQRIDLSKETSVPDIGLFSDSNIIETKTINGKEYIPDYLNKNIVYEEFTIEEKRDIFIKAYKSGFGIKSGGGYISNHSVDKDGYLIYEKDEDIKKGFFAKGIDQKSIADMLPRLTIKELNSFIRNKNKSNETSAKLDNIINNLDASIKNELFTTPISTGEDFFHPNMTIKKGSMDSRKTDDVVTVGNVISETVNIRENLFQYIMKNKGDSDFTDPEFAQSFANTANIIIENLDKYELNKNIEFRQHKMAEDRYTRGTYSFGDDIAIPNENYVAGSENGYMFQIDGGVVDIYYGKGFYDETSEGVVQNELRQDISLSTNSELIMHEILHSMIEKAYFYDKNLNRSLFLLKEQVMKQISYKNILSKDESESTQAEIQLAKYIYAHMQNPTEFLAYAATNQNVFNAIKNLKISQQLIGKFEAKRGKTLGSFKEFLNRLIEVVNKVYTAMTTGESAKNEFDKILSNLIEVNTKIEIGAIDLKYQKEFKPYELFGFGEKYKKTNDMMLEAEEGTFSKIKEIWSADSVRDKAEATSRFIESIGKVRGLGWLRESRILSDLVTDITEDTTLEGSAWFYEAVRHIKGTREKDKMDFAAVMKKKIASEFSEFTKEERDSVTFMIQGDWKALGVSLEEYKNMLQDETIVNKRIDEIKSKLVHKEYINQSMLLGYYLVTGEAKGSALMKNAHQIYFRYHTGKQASPLNNGLGNVENLKLIDELSSLYAIKYTEKDTKENIIKSIDRDASVVSFASDVYYTYRDKELTKGQLADFGIYMDKGYVRKSGVVDIKFDIVPESKLIKNSKFTAINHNIIRERPDIQKALRDAGLNFNNEKYYLVSERDMDPARTQGVLDDISILETGQELASFTAGNNLTYADSVTLNELRFKADKTYLNRQLDDSIESLRNMDNFSIPELDINGRIKGFSEKVSEADKINHGRVNNDIADVLGNTASHINSKEKALINNQNFIDLLIEDSNINVGNPAYVYLSADSEDIELQKYWAMIPEYSRQQILADSNKGIWVKRSRINNIVGYKDVSISNMELFGKRLEDYPSWQRALKIVEHTWKEIASAYKEIIVKLMPNVIIGNASSNIFVAVRHGIGPIEYAKAFKNAWTDLSEYMTLNEELTSLKIDRDVGKKGLDVKINELDNRLKRNGMHKLIKDGQFSMIFEDLDKDLVSKSTHLKDVSTAKIEKMFGKNAAENIEEFRQNIYVTKDTRGHQAIEKLTLYNDIINRKIIMDKMFQDLEYVNFATEEAREAAEIDVMNYLDQLFVNYSYLTNKYVKWASDLNIVLFIKYFLRAGKASLNMMRRQPLGSTIAESFDTFIWDMPDPIDQYMNPIDTFSGKIGLSPIDMVLEIISPNILNPIQ